MRILRGVCVMAVVLGAANMAWAVSKPPVTWVSSPNYSNSSRTAASIDTVVVHTTEGTYSGAISWFQNPSAQVSAHYVISSTGAITQMVADEDVAWHATYYNSRSIGIECAGYSAQASTWTPALRASLDQLTAWLCVTYGVTISHPGGTAYNYANNTFTAAGLVGHYQVQPWNRSDPGSYFDWNGFVSSVQSIANGGGTPTTPDLTVTSVSVNQSNTNVGKVLTFSAVVKNGGNGGVASGVAVQVAYKVNGTQVATGTVYGPIAAGASATAGTASGSWTVSVPGTFSVSATADSSGAVAESSETNNTASTSKTALGAYRVTTGTLNVRSGPSTSNSIVGTTALNQMYAAMQYSGGWYKIWYRGGTGWFYAAYTASAPGVAGVKVNTSTLNVRSGPSSMYTSVGTCSSGQVYVRNSSGSTATGWTSIFFDGSTANRCVYTSYTLPVGF